MFLLRLLQLLLPPINTDTIIRHLENAWKEGLVKLARGGFGSSLWVLFLGVAHVFNGVTHAFVRIYIASRFVCWTRRISKVNSESQADENNAKLLHLRR